MRPRDRQIVAFDPKNNFKKFSAVIFFHFLVIKALDPHWIRIRIGSQPKMLDTDPDEMNADPQPCLREGDGEVVGVLPVTVVAPQLGVEVRMAVG